jgi:hypothetical protein
VNSRIRAIVLAGAALTALAASGCGTLPVQPLVDTPGPATTSARMIDTAEGPGETSSPAVTPGGETVVPAADDTQGKGPKKVKKPKRNR